MKEGVKKVLVAISSTRYFRGVEERLLEEILRLPAGAYSVTILYILEREAIEKIHHSLEDYSFLGRKTVEGILKEISREQESLGQERVSFLKSSLEERGIETEVVEKVGTYRETIPEFLSGRDYETIFIVKSKRTFLSRLLLGSEGDLIERMERKGPEGGGRESS